MARAIAWFAILAALAAVGFGVPPNLSDYLLRIMIVICINVVLVTSMGLANGFTGVFSLGQVGFVATGAYVSGILSMPLAAKASLLPDLSGLLAGVELGFLSSTLVAGVICAAIALLVGIPLMRLSGHHVSVATMGFMIIVDVIIINADAFTRGARTFAGVPTDTTLPWALGWAALTVFLLSRLIYSPIGLALRAVREDRIASQAIGLSVLRTRLVAFVVGAFFAGVGGSLYGHYLGSFSSHSFYFPLMVSLIAMLVLGGMGSISGAVIGVLLVTALSEILRNLERGMEIGSISVPPLYGASQIVLGVLLILVMIYRPTGLLGDRELTLPGLRRVHPVPSLKKD